MKAFIKDIAYYLPEKIVTNEDLVKEFPEWSVDKIAEKVGVKQRHVATDETALDLAQTAAEKLFAKGAVQKENVDFVLLCTQSPDYILPTSACILQDRLGLSTGTGALDFNLGCSGYEYGLALAKGLVISGVSKNVLLLTAETYNKHLHSRDKGNRTIFGDGASATIVSSEGFAEIGEFVLGTKGKGAEFLMVKTGGSRYPEKQGEIEFDEGGNPKSPDYLFMDGQEIFMFTLMTVPKMIKQTLAKHELEKDQIDLFVFHQANKYMLEHLKGKLKIDDEKFFMNLENVGNTVSSTIPIALVDAREQGKLKGKVLIAGFGVGLSWGATILEVKE
jgi:3-oxoacyl-[acyl-carrier-protein] synthase-3